jgi:hypothetical protein
MNKNERPGCYTIPSYGIALMWKRVIEKAAYNEQLAMYPHEKETK